MIYLPPQPKRGPAELAPTPRSMTYAEVSAALDSMIPEANRRATETHRHFEDLKRQIADVEARIRAARTDARRKRLTETATELGRRLVHAEETARVASHRLAALGFCSQQTEALADKLAAAEKFLTDANELNARAAERLAGLDQLAAEVAP